MTTTESPKPASNSGAYSLAKARGKCFGCAKDIIPGEKFFAALRETPLALERLDLCSSCWEKFEKAGLLGFWQMTMPHATAKRPLFIDDEVLCELFERLADAVEPAKLNFRFVLGLILMRKRRLIYDSTTVKDGREIWTMRLRGREETLELLNPKLDEQQVAEVSTQLGEILSADL
ncbi:MAG: hypothetical protein M3O30_11780 [Planctomycetota bacterium]|nr:hypothetical protein [Planctomycetota bacterium]